MGVLGIITLLIYIILLSNHFTSALESHHNLLGLANFTFSNLDNGSNIHQNEYPVINFTLHGRNESYVMHLIKPDDLFDPGSLVPHDHQTNYSCVYSANIFSNGEIVGSGSLSSCQYLTALEGLITLDNVHYHVTPDLTEELNKLQRTRVKRYVAEAVYVPHKILHVHKPPPEGYRGHDEIHVDPEKLRNAYSDMLRSQENLESEGSNDDGMGNTDNRQNEILETGLKGSKGKHPKLSKKIKGKIKGNRKISRVVELALFTDEAFYAKWKKKAPKDTDKEINKFILALVNNMNFLFNQPSMMAEISFRLVRLQVLKTTPATLYVTNNGEKYLESFCNFAGKKDKFGYTWDHAMMLSGLDLTDADENNILGIAYTSTMCLRFLSCSLVEFKDGFETSFTSTHEVGHNLGMEHDGENFNKKCDAGKYLMAAVDGEGQINWSPCSNNNLMHYFVTGDPDPAVKSMMYKPECLTKKGLSKSAIEYQNGKAPGQKYSAKEQCGILCKGCTPYMIQEKPYDNICWMLHCKNINDQIFPAHPALEGTTCGQDKKILRKCWHGKCH